MKQSSNYFQKNRRLCVLLQLIFIQKIENVFLVFAMQRKKEITQKRNGRQFKDD
jgi:hypothetical protein